MKKIVTLVSALLLVSAVSALAAGPGPFFVPGDYLNAAWGFTGDQMTESGGVWSATIVSDAAPGVHGFKISVDGWSENYGWNGNNGQLTTTNPNEPVYFTFDTNTYSDGYQPNTNIVWSDHCIPPGMQFEVMGSSNGWSAPIPATLVAGVWKATGNAGTAGPQEFKFRTVGTWSGLNFGAQQGDAGGANATYTTTVDNQSVLFEFNTLTGRVRATPQSVVPTRQTTFGSIKAQYR